MQSTKNTLNSTDVEEWLIQTGIYSIVLPIILVFLTSLQNGIDFKAAVTTATYALLSALVNLLGKLQAGGVIGSTVTKTVSSVVPPNTQSVATSVDQHTTQFNPDVQQTVTGGTSGE